MKDLLFAIGLVVKNDIPSATPDVGTNRGQSHVVWNQLGHVSTRDPVECGW
jgi:hypothetical protein